MRREIPVWSVQVRQTRGTRRAAGEGSGHQGAARNILNILSEGFSLETLEGAAVRRAAAAMHVHMNKCKQHTHIHTLSLPLSLSSSQQGK